MNILVLGANGQVGRALGRYPEVTTLNREEADLRNPKACAQIVGETDAKAVINAAAYTAVDQAETEEHIATVINADSPTEMAIAAAKRSIPFLSVSTDYVFDGSGNSAWAPDASTSPLNAYGRSKLKGEQGIVAAGGQFAILRTSWVFSATGSNFVKTMLRLGQERDALRIVDDQIGGPTAAQDIADCLMKMARQMAKSSKGGIYHYASAPAVSWAGFAREVFALSGLNVAVTGISSAEFPTPAARPQNSRLDCQSLFDDFGIGQPDWRASLANVLAELQGEHHDKP